MNKYACTRWAFDLSTWTPTLPQLALAVAAVQPEERIRLMKFYFIDDFLSSLLGRLLMRKFVSQNTSLDYHEVQFARDVRGKPYWLVHKTQTAAASPQLSFNVSHQGDFVVLAGLVAEQAAAADFGVGADVMKIEYSGGKSLSEFFRIMNSKFSESEWRCIKRAHYNEAERIKAFMRHWCLKEAYVKELGVGITIDLQKISFTVDSEHELEIETQPLTNVTLRCNDVPMLDWHFEEHLLNSKYCAAIAFKNCKPAKDKFEFLKIAELLVYNAKAKDAEILDYCKKVLQKQRKT